MANRIILKELGDWSKIDASDAFFAGIDTSRDENFGLHIYNGNLWTSGLVGVGRLFGANGYPLTTGGKERVVVINSKYGMDPWVMLEKVMTDDEYEDYIDGLDDGKFLFKIFYDQPVIQLTQDQKCDADILYALSFINLCFSLCKKGIKKQMIHKEENLTAKIRGRIDVQKNIRQNTSKGRNDRFFCKYIDFSSDTAENRILKAALVRCKKIIEQKFEMDSQIVGRLYYCMNSFRSVKLVKIGKQDFNSANTNGLYSYYKPLIKQAKCILSRKYHSYIAEDGKTVIKSVYTVPYMINMETVFEFYVRIVFKETLNQSGYYLEKYSEKIYIEKGVANAADVKEGIHLMPYCIPDIIICDNTTKRPVMVLDAKYKASGRSDRNDTHQLLSYVLLTGVRKCGFVLPGKETKVKPMRSDGQTARDHLILASPPAHDLRYYELILGNTADPAEIHKLFI